MKTLELASFEDFVLSNEEMINVRGGNNSSSMSPDGDERPPIIISM